MSTTRLLILGLVNWLQPVHGYDVRRELMSWNVDQWANIQPGSIYHALRKLTEEGLLAEVSTAQVGNRPARTTYRVTPKGEREFGELLRKYWWEYKTPVDPFGVAFSLMPGLPRREAVAALRNRARVLETFVAGFRDVTQADSPWMQDKPVHVHWMFELGIERAEVEARWCRRVADLVEAGEGSHAGESANEEMNRRWRAEMDGRTDLDVKEE